MGNKLYRKAHEIKLFKTYEEMDQTIRANHKRFKLPYPMWLTFAIEEASDWGDYDKLFNLLLKKGGQVESWSKYHENRTGVSWKIFFSDFQAYLWLMVEDCGWKYNSNMPFLDNYYNQCKLLAKNVLKAQLLTNKAKANNNSIDFSERADYTPDYRNTTPYTQKYKVEYEVQKVDIETLEISKEIRTETVYTSSSIEDKHRLAICEMCNRGYKNVYEDIDLITSIEQLNVDRKDKDILYGLATGKIEKKAIPAVLGWTNKKDRMKLSRYCKKLAQILVENKIVL